MKRFLVLALLAGVLAVVPQAASAAPISPGCQQLNQPTHDGYYSDVETPGLQFFQGEVLRVRAGDPSDGASWVHLLVDQGVVVDAPFPGRAVWAVPADGTYVIGWEAGGDATWRVSCRAATVPFAPQGLLGAPGDGWARISWGTPAFGGGAPIDDYRVQYRLKGTNDWTIVPDEVSTVRHTYVYGLANGETYRFRVAAHNAYGWGPWSLQVAVRAGAPTEPRAPATTPGDGQVQVSWGAPFSEGGAPVTDYVVHHRIKGTTTWAVFCDGRSTVRHTNVLGLTNGETYEFRAAAKNAYGRGPWSEVVEGSPTA
ncbi:MAG: fibronectin type III domain-containing protein [Actinomycetota bacterium]